MKTILTTILSLVMLPSISFAQDDEPKHIRFIPLGELWTWDEELKDNIRVGKPAPPGANPPKPVSLASGGGVIPFDLNYSIFTKLMTMKGGTKGLEIKKGKAPESPFWLRSAKPAAPLSLGVLSPDPATMFWHKPEMLLLKDDADSFPANHMRFVNLTDRVIYVQIGQRKPRYFGIAAGKSSLKQITVGANFIKVTGNNPSSGGEEELILQTSIKILSGQRVQSFYYNARPKKGKKAIKQHFAVEQVPKLPANPK